MRKVDPRLPEQTIIEHAAAVIRRGGLVAFPTETVYGLGANALDAHAAKKIYEAKQRAADDPCIVHISDLEDLARVVDLPPEPAPIARWVAVLAAACWPGPLSLILPKSAAIPDVVTAGRRTVAVRMPDHPVAVALIRAAGVPIAAPSANIFMHTSPTTAQHVLDDLQGRIDMLLDGGPAPLGVESTVLDLSSTLPAVLRPGGVSLERLRELLGEDLVIQPGTKKQSPGEEGGWIAPGLLEKHYAPRVTLLLFDGPVAPIRQELARRTRVLLQEGRRVGALLPDEDADALEALIYDGGKAASNRHLPGTLSIARLGHTQDLAAIARRLYAGMRELETEGAEIILARSLSDEGLGRAIRDRLIRAAGGAIIRL